MPLMLLFREEGGLQILPLWDGNIKLVEVVVKFDRF